MRKRVTALIVLGLALCVVVAWLLASRWRATAAPVLVGTVQLGAVDLKTLDGFIQGMTELGYVEGRDILYRKTGPAGSVKNLEQIVAGHVAAGVDLFFVSSSPGTLAVKAVAERLRIPAVFAPVNDPVAAGIVTDMRRPGGQLTGVRLPPGDDLRMQWFQRAAPDIRRVYFPYNPNDPSAQESLRQARAASQRLGLELVLQPIADAADIPGVLQAVPDHVDAMFLARDSTVDTEIAQFVAAATRQRIPVCASSLTGVLQGALMSYGFDHHEIGRQAAHLADQVLRGVPPGDLPVETAASYLGINLDAAAAIGFEFPPAILRQAHLQATGGIDR